MFFTTFLLTAIFTVQIEGFVSILNLENISEFEIVYLPVLLFQDASNGIENRLEGKLNFTMFGRSVLLNLQSNEKLLSPHLKSYTYENNHYKIIPDDVPERCHYIHRDDFSTAAISSCEANSVQGFLFLNSGTYGILPLNSQLHLIVSPLQVYGEEGQNPHVVYKVTAVHNPLQFRHNLNHNPYLYDRNATEDNSVELTAEVALFFDAEAYQKFAPYFSDDEKKLREMLLIYMNGIQALYHHPSLGTKLDLVLVRIDIMKHQPAELPHYEGERSKLLDSFCKYQKNLNPSSDDDPNHWDIGLYLSGLDFFEIDETGQGDTGTLGLSTVGGVCYPQYACVIAEMGATNVFGEPYPSAGFASIYISAHEIGHNLGMSHDGTKNGCPTQGYIMSPSRGVSGETQWSSCSAEIMKKLNKAKCLRDFTGIPNKNLDHSKYNQIPGQTFTAKQQCEIFLRDKDAIVSPNQELAKICDSIECKTPNRGGSYFGGPALEGTECGVKKFCHGGECVSKSETLLIASDNRIPDHQIPGYKKNRYFYSSLYSDGQQISTFKHASNRCNYFSKLLPSLNLQGVGLQATHEESKTWMACSIFCLESDGTSYYTPRGELKVMGISPYFLDGTWCHRDSNNVNYYCQRHHCLPEMALLIEPNFEESVIQSSEQLNNIKVKGFNFIKS